jgi:hypothetical protein
VTSATFVFTATAADAGFEVDLDGHGFAAAANPYTVESLALGAHELLVRAVSSTSGTDATPASYQWRVTPPPPDIRIDFPPPQSLTDASQLTVKGRARSRSELKALHINGVTATSTDGFQTWRAVIPLTTGRNAITAEAQDVAGNLSNVGELGVVRRLPYVAATLSHLDWKANRLIGVDSGTNSLVEIDQSTGNFTVLASNTLGAGGAFRWLRRFAIDAAKSTAYVPDLPGVIVAVKLATGNRKVWVDLANSKFAGLNRAGVLFDDPRQQVLAIADEGPSLLGFALPDAAPSLLSGPTRGTGPAFFTPYGMDLDAANGRVFVLGAQEQAGPIDDIFVIDLASGDRSLLSVQWPQDVTVALQAIAFDAANQRLFGLPSGPSQQAIFVIDLASGTTQLIAGYAQGAREPYGESLIVGQDGNVLYVALDSPATLLRVDVASGEWTQLVDHTLGEGPRLLQAQDFDIAADARHAFAANGEDIVDIDLLTGKRRILSSARQGAGVPLVAPQALAVDASEKRLLVVDGNLSEILSVDMQTGERSLLAMLGIDPFVSSGIGYDAATRRALILDGQNKTLHAVDVAGGNAQSLDSVLSGACADWTMLSGAVRDPLSDNWLVGANTGLVSVDLAAGECRFAFQNNIALPYVFFPNGFAFVPQTNTAYTANTQPYELKGFNLTTADVSILPDNNNGPVPYRIRDTRYDPLTETIWLLDSQYQALFAVEPQSGDRVIVSR